MKINEHQLNWFLKVTNTTIGDLVKWLKWWSNRRRQTYMPCLHRRYRGFFIFTNYDGRGRFVDGCEVYFAKTSRLVDSLQLSGILRNFNTRKHFKVELIQALEQLKKEKEQ